jgi:uncharacterized protein YjbI with pentapeptide repeats
MMFISSSPAATIRNRMAALLALSALALPVQGAGLNRESVAAAVGPGCTACASLAMSDLSNLDLSDLDLSGADLHGANLTGATFFGTRLVKADLHGAQLDHANLNGAWVMGTNFDGASLRGASMIGLVVLGGEVKTRPTFRNADLSEVRVIAELDTADLTGARLEHLRGGVNIRNQGMGQDRLNLSGARLVGAHMSGADVNRALLRFADLSGADLRGANLFRTDFSGAHLNGADLRDADIREVIFDGADLTDAKMPVPATGSMP